jgi:hypothetical protein
MACTSTPTAPAPSAPAEPTIAGTYTLATIAGQPMPYAPADGVTYVAGRLVLRRDSTFTDVRTINANRTTVEFDFVGSFSVRGDSVRFSSQSYLAPFAMGWTLGTLTARWDEGLFVYRR